MIESLVLLRKALANNWLIAASYFFLKNYYDTIKALAQSTIILSCGDEKSMGRGSGSPYTVGVLVIEPKIELKNLIFSV